MINTLKTCLYAYDDIEGYLLHEVAREAIESGLPVTFDKRYLDSKHRPKKGETPFVEIGIVPVRETTPDKWDDKIFTKQEPWAGDLGSYAEELQYQLEEHFAAAWDVSKPTIIHCSSGYDSRIMSSALMNMQEHGMKLGDIHFRCHEPEQDAFFEIMKRQGWKKSQYSSFSPKDTADYYDIGLRAPNGWLPISNVLNFDRDLTGGKPENFNLVTGLGGGEIFHYPAAKIGPFKDYDNCENPFINLWLNNFMGNHEMASQLAAEYNQLILPFFSYEYLGVAAQCPKRFLKLHPKTKWGNRPDYVRMAILDTFPWDLSDIPYGHHDYHWNVSKGRINQMAEFWDRCKFKKHTGLGKIQPVKPHPKKPGRQIVGDHNSKIFGFALLYEKVFG